MKRLFIGIPMSSGKAAQTVRQWQDDPPLNQNHLAWTKISNWHITLAFLGPTPETAVSLLGNIIEEAFQSCPAYTCPLSGVGIFPDQRRPRVLWLGLENTDPLQPCYRKLTQLLLLHHFHPDSKPLKPHLTVARVKSLINPVAFSQLLDQYQAAAFGEVAINRILLYESLSTPNGVVYLPLYEKKLQEREG